MAITGNLPWKKLSSCMHYLVSTQVANETIKDCKACAVGSVLKYGLNPQTSYFDACESARRVTKGRYRPKDKPVNYMSALSIFWESLGDNAVPVEEARAITLDWVEETFPDDEVLGEV